MNAKSEVSGLLQIAGEKKGLLIAASVFSVVSSLLQIAPFAAVYVIVEELLKHAGNPASLDKELLLQGGVAALVALAAALAAMYVSVMCSHIAAFDILYRLRVRLAEHVAKVPMGYHTTTATGELKKIIEVSVEKIEKFIAHQLPDIVSAVAVPLLFVGGLIWLDWRLALALLVPIGFGFWLQARMFGSEGGRRAYREFQYATEEMNATGIEYVRGMPAVKVFGVKADDFLTFRSAVNRYRDLSIRITDLYKTPYSVFFVLTSSLFTFAAPVGVALASGGADSRAFAVTFILFLIVTPSLSAPLLKLMYAGGAMREIVEGNKRIAAVLAEAPVEEPLRPLAPVSYEISFERVSFSYDNMESKDYKPALRAIDFVAKQGETTALVGPSGGGKSTIANLLLRFWDVQEGVIKIGGVPIRDIGTEKLMETVSFVFQDVHLFYDTIEENIRMGNAAASRKDVEAAAKAACCHGFIEKLPGGYDTKIGEGGTYLSGGEVQRIAIARALLKNAPILVLDEATAYADAENESNIRKGLAELAIGKTVLIIAHRLSAVRNAEQILVVKQGEVAERGTHEELRKRNGLYEQMWLAHTSAASWRLGRTGAPIAAGTAAREGSGQ
ncbi:ABC transporter ATP-binding protein [Cohnella sp.]|uniref:ABC transporter ATP-binding protein n=1 Tax=Cohnella sp. TaxID=1883426 RepID=UPI0035651DF5